MKTKITFKNYPEFTPDLTPKQCIRAGIFGGIYFNPIGGKPGIISKEVNIDYKEFPKEWFKGLDKKYYLSRRYDKNINKYKVVAGMNQEFWERKGWINPQDPRGWFQWYMRFYMGRRTSDDIRQIKRWKNVQNRWSKFLLNRIKKQHGSIDDTSISPVVRQTLLHWACEISSH